MPAQSRTLVTLMRIVILINTSVTGPNYRSVVSHNAPAMLWKGCGKASFHHFKEKCDMAHLTLSTHLFIHSPLHPPIFNWTTLAEPIA